MNQTTDAICGEFADKGVRITMKALAEDRSYVLIEGDKMAFEFLGKLLLAHADQEDCGFFLAPNGPGSALFSPTAELGLYLHRLPCIETKQ